jgi:pyruvate, orthophosphate dikinase
VRTKKGQFDAASSILVFPQSSPVSELPSKDRFGSKAVSLMRMAAAGLPVPPGFVIGTEVCRQYMKHGRQVIDDLVPDLERALQQLGEQTGRHLGDSRRPLLVSVRSGAAISMPGMMETILNIGLNRVTAKGLVRMTGNPRLAADCRRRLVSQYGEVVEGIPAELFESLLRSFLESCGASALDELDTASLNRLADHCEEIFADKCGSPLPQEPVEQLHRAVAAVLKSWNGELPLTDESTRSPMKLVRR